MLNIVNLSARVAGKDILKGVNLEVKPGEVHAIMGPNGSGKSTLAQVLAGRTDYEVTGGSVTFEGQDLLALPPEERARAGLFLGFQYPVEIPGVNNVYLLKAALNAKRKAAGQPEVDAYDFLALIKQKMKVMQMSEAFLTRGVNEGFSGGEKKRNEVLQMLVLEPKLAILDETDSGLDIDALKVVSMGVNSLRDPSRAVVLVTHYQRLLDYIVPDYVHVLSGGRILKSGDRSLALELERRGYDWVQGIPARMSAAIKPAAVNAPATSSPALRSFEAQWAARAPDALAGLRESAMRRVLRLGLPTPRDETWKYTNLRRLSAGSFGEAPRVAAGDLPDLGALALLKAADTAITVVLINGRPIPGAAATPCSRSDVRWPRGARCPRGAGGRHRPGHWHTRQLLAGFGH